MTRNELDMPLALGKNKVVPFVAGTFGYENGNEFRPSIDEAPVEPEEEIWIGEAGRSDVLARFRSGGCIRAFESRFWDLEPAPSHVIRPRAYGRGLCRERTMRPSSAIP